MESKKMFPSSLFGDFQIGPHNGHGGARHGHEHESEHDRPDHHIHHPALSSESRPISPAPSGRFNLQRVSQSISITTLSSSSSTATSASVPDGGLSPENSCATRETFRGECARHRFIVWAAVKRNSCQRMTPSERLECPLLRCRRRFADHELMLRHLAECEHLNSCEYWCYEHMRVERFDDSKCKRCLGHPSKRRKMLGMAKSFFSSLGHKGRKGVAGIGGLEFGGDEESLILLPPPSYDSLGLANANRDDDDASSTTHVELSGNEIAEIDSTEVASISPTDVAPAPAVVVDPQTLHLPELDSRNMMVDNQIMDDHFMQWQPTPSPVPSAAIPASSYSPSPPLESSSLFLDAVGETGDVGLTKSCGQRPSLQLNTHGLEQYRKPARPRPRPVPAPSSRSKDLSPSSSVRSTASTMSNLSSVISPASVWSYTSTMCSGFATNLTSPTGDPVSPGGFLPCDGDDMGFPVEGHCLYDDSNNNITTATTTTNTRTPPELHDLFELPADLPEVKVTPEDLSSDPVLFAFDTALPADYSYASDVVLTEEGMTMDLGLIRSVPPQLPQIPQVTQTAEAPHGSKPPPSGPPVLTDSAQTIVDASATCQPDTKVLVGSAWDTLLAHVASSHAKIQHISSNPLADQLRSLSPRMIATSGLRTLRTLLDGQLSTSPIDTLCLIHVVYALSLIVFYDNDVSARCTQLYLQSLAIASLFSSREKPLYTQLAAEIWHPNNLTRVDFDQGLLRQYPSLHRRPSKKGKEHAIDLRRHIPYRDDPLICTARSFLDELECAAILGPSSGSLEVLTSSLWDKHVQSVTAEPAISAPFMVTTRFIITQLIQKFGKSKDLSRRLKEVHERIISRSIPSVRRFELELLQAGKTCLPSDVYFDGFCPLVGNLCDGLYQQHFGGSLPRSLYHGHDITLMDTIISELDMNHAAVLGQTMTEDAALEEFLNSITTTGDNTDDILLSFNSSSTTLDLGDQGGAVEAAEDTNLITDVPPAPASGPPSSSPHNGQCPEPVPTAVTAESSSASSSSSPPQQQKIEANDCCEICGYRPKGDPQWFRGSMAKHKKLQHSDQPPKIYKCQFPGCNSQYKNRPDNLRQHQIEKNHFIDGEQATRRPSKRKKISEE